MASKRQRADAAKKKEKRTKLFAIVGCVLLVAVGAYEIPPMLAIMNKKPPNTTYDPGPSTGRGGPLPNIAAGTVLLSHLQSCSSVFLAHRLTDGIR